MLCMLFIHYLYLCAILITLFMFTVNIPRAVRLDSEGGWCGNCCMPSRGCCCCFEETGCCCFEGVLIPQSHPVLLFLFGSLLAEMAVELGSACYIDH